MILFGAGGHCKPILDILFLRGVKVERIYDRDPKVEDIFGVKVLRQPQEVSPDTSGFISIGDNTVRKRLAEQLGLSFEAVVHPNTSVSSFSSVDEGTVVMAGVILNAGAVVGKHCILNSGCVVEHDCFIEDFVHISPGASLGGGVHVGEGAHVGMGANVIQGIKIGKWSKIGAGAVIIKDVPDYATVVGNPGRII